MNWTGERSASSPEGSPFPEAINRKTSERLLADFLRVRSREDGCGWPLSSLTTNYSDGLRLRSLGVAAACGDLLSDPLIDLRFDPADGARA